MRARAALLLAVLLAAPGLKPAQGEEPESPVPAEVPAQAHALLERLAAALPPGPPALVDVYDLEALAERARVQTEVWRGVKEGPDAPARRAAWLEAARATVEASEEHGDTPAFTSQRVLRWQPGVEGKPGQLVAAIFEGSQVWTLRLWLGAPGPDGAWRIADSDFPLAGLRDSFLLTHQADGQVLPEALADSLRLKSLREAERLLDEDRPAEALEGLTSLLRLRHDGPLGAYFEQRRAGFALAAAEPATAAQALEAARAADASVGAMDWLHAQVLEAQEDDRGALRALEAHRAAFGDELRGLRARIRLWEGQGRPERALELARRGADLYPRFHDFAGAVLRLLPAGQRAEALPLLARVDDVAGAIEEALDPDDPLAADGEVLEVAVQALEAKQPEHPHLGLYRAARQALEGDVAGAQGTLRAALENLPQDAPRDTLLHLLVRLPWLGASRQTPEALRDAVVGVLEAAAPADRAWVFSALGYELAGGEGDLALEGLLQGARRLGQVGPDLLYYDAELAWMRGDLEQVLAALAALGTPALPEDGHPSLDLSLGYWPLELRVRSLVRLGRAQEALAPARACFVRRGSATLLAIAHAHVGNVEVVERAFAHESERGGDLQDLYEDDDLHDVLQREAYAPLRERHGLR